MKPLRLDDAARDELLHEVRFLEAARRGSGRKFREAVAQAFERIRRNPACGREDDEGCRRLRVGGFRLSIVFREAATEVVVFVIRPDSRQPGYWHSRVK